MKTNGETICENCQKAKGEHYHFTPGNIFWCSPIWGKNSQFKPKPEQPTQSAKRLTQLDRLGFIVAALRIEHLNEVCAAEELYDSLFGEQTAPPEVKK